MSTLGLTTNVSGHRKYPFPQSGRNANNDPNPKPSDSASDTLWQGYINYVKGLSGTYKQKYGYRTLMDYLQEQRYDPSQSEDLWRTPEYPDQALKDGTTLFLSFLKDLQFGDEVGFVVYGQWAVQQTEEFYDGDANVDISADPITSDYDKINTIQLHHQSGEYNGWTAMGDGILKGRTLAAGRSGCPKRSRLLALRRPADADRHDRRRDQPGSERLVDARRVQLERLDRLRRKRRGRLHHHRYQQEVCVLSGDRSHQTRLHDPHGRRRCRCGHRPVESDRVRR